MIRPSGPVPATLEMSMPLSSASDLASGEANRRPPLRESPLPPFGKGGLGVGVLVSAVVLTTSSPPLGKGGRGDLTSTGSGFFSATGAGAEVHLHYRHLI